MAARASRTGRAKPSTSWRAPWVWRLTTLATLLWMSSPPGTPEVAGILPASKGRAAATCARWARRSGWGPTRVWWWSIRLVWTVRSSSRPGG